MEDEKTMVNSNSESEAKTAEDSITSTMTPEQEPGGEMTDGAETVLEAAEKETAEAEIPETAPMNEKTEEEINETEISKEAPTPVTHDINLENRIGKIEETENKLLSEVREMHKLYHNEYAGRLRNMQEELEYYRKLDKGRAYDDILSAVARIYVNYESLEDEADDPKVKKNIHYMLMDIEELLELYGMSRLRNEPGEKRNTRHCQVVKRFSTDDPSKHDVIAKVYNSGFYIENRSIIKEMVDIYLYDEKAAGTEQEQQMESEEQKYPEQTESDIKNMSEEQEEL